MARADHGPVRGGDLDAEPADAKRVYYAGCPGKYVVWQYEISAGSTPDVDHDEATNQLPLWYQ